jgi:macrodomain Ter protein organizer (MatP/YcbG family)
MVETVVWDKMEVLDRKVGMVLVGTVETVWDTAETALVERMAVV